MQHVVGLAPGIEAGAGGFEHFSQRGEVAVVSSQPPSQLPHPFDRNQLQAVWRQEQEAQLSSVLTAPKQATDFRVVHAAGLGP